MKRGSRKMTKCQEEEFFVGNRMDTSSSETFGHRNRVVTAVEAGGPCPFNWNKFSSFWP